MPVIIIKEGNRAVNCLKRGSGIPFEDEIKLLWPECAAMLRDESRHYMTNRIEAHNRLCGEILATTLTRREYEVAMLVVYGKRNKEIADTLGISANTVRTLLYNIFHKLRLTQRSELSDFIYSFKPPVE